MKRSAFLRIYRIPAVLSFLTLFGLASALLGAGMWDMFSWLTLLIPLLIIAWMWINPRQNGRR